MFEPQPDSPHVNCDESESHIQFRMLCEHIRSFAAVDLRSEQWNFLAAQTICSVSTRCQPSLSPPANRFLREELASLGLFERVGDELQLSSLVDDNVELYVKIDESDQTITFSAGSEFLFPLKRTALDYALDAQNPRKGRGAYTSSIRWMLPK